ncbi:response regulator [Bacteriovorax sp. Seq25_V]|uniref:response regulator n=1 Tax=Bacteriovorax sp. Seq25_V TaxID=1201288 RepID=UPI000389E7DC|nr:response regulator [Bacteriovorax sp. Seq25_V]EQC45529.1 response regulator receiver domain protein [Bacteriovorax sp. Seq25_V]
MTSEAFQFVFVDDEPDIKDIYEVFLSSLFGDELKFEFFLNGEECLKFLESKDMEGKHVLIISDINMPKMDGFTLLKNISNKFENAEVALSSAYDNTDYKEKGYSLGAIDFIPKPVDFTRIAQLIRDRLN